jgi:hypothetical protein
MSGTDIPERHPIFLFLLTNIGFLASIAFAWLAFSTWLSIRSGDWLWLSRSGSVLGIVGAVLACRGTLRLTREERVAIRNMNLIQCFTREELEDQERDSIAAIVGIVLLISGTLIWGYGDLVGNVF